MALIDYPADLPLPLQENYGLQHVDPLVRTPMQSGRVRQRRQFTSVPTNIPVSWLFDNGEALLFEGWFVHQITDGTDWFNCPLKTPMGIKHYEARFIGVYDGPRLISARFWKITAQLELRERQIMDRDWITIAPQFVSGLSLIDRAVNKELPEA